MGKELAVMPSKTKSGKQSKRSDTGENTLNTTSETTIYDNVVGKEKTDTVPSEDDEVTFNFNKQKLDTSSDEQGDTSDEIINVTDQFIADCAAEAERRRSGEVLDIPQDHEIDRNHDISHAEEQIREAEAAKLRIAATPGNVISSMDDHYLVVGGHVDAVMRDKIINHEYVDFSRLLPKDKIMKEDDHRMELINKGGFTYFVPVADRESAGSISSFSHWEQAFRIFANVYMHAYPERSTELIQYNHIIFTAAQTFCWDNVYLYDREFRMHLSHFPQRKWSIILQQVWSLCLKDHLKATEDNRFKTGANAGSNHSAKKEICKWFNKGCVLQGPVASMITDVLLKSVESGVMEPTYATKGLEHHCREVVVHHLVLLLGNPHQHHLQGAVVQQTNKTF